jgi:hypothetical protein
MNHKILIAAIVGLSLASAAQTQPGKQKTGTSTTPTQSKHVAKGYVSGGKMAQDDWHQTAKSAPSSDTKPTHVVAGDVNGDGRADVMAKDKAPRDAATRQATGKRMYKPITITKEVDKADPKLDPASGQMAGKRQHEPMTVKKEVDKSTPLLKQ